jgi:hypothetical protein
MAAGKVVFDGTLASLTDAAARDLYGIASDSSGNADPALSDGMRLPIPSLGHAVA